MLNDFASLPVVIRQYVRQTIIENITNPESLFFNSQRVQSEAIIPLGKAEMHMPMKLTDYTDFYTSVVHAETVSIYQNTSCNFLRRTDLMKVLIVLLPGGESAECSSPSSILGVPYGIQWPHFLCEGVRDRCNST